MRIDFIRRTVFNIDPPAIRLPPRNARRETIVGIGDAAIMFFAVLVLFGVRSRIAAQPEIFDKRLPLVVGLERLENLPLFIGYNVADLFVQPPLIRCLQFLLQLRFVPLLLLLSLGLGNRFFAGGTRRGLRRRRLLS